MSKKLPYVFISYQTSDKLCAGKIQAILRDWGIKSFLAHEDIEVSSPWRDRILRELDRADIFICLISKNFDESPWCLQESGIAAFRGIQVMPLSLDGTTPRGFVSAFQSKKIDPSEVELDDVVDGLRAYDPGVAADILISRLSRAGDFRTAESYMEPLMDMLDEISSEQGKLLLEACYENNQIHHAADCASLFIPEVLERFSDAVDTEAVRFLEERVAQYQGYRQ